MKKNNINNKKICVISTFGHCGIDWLHSLIDSHRNILIMPGFSFFRTVETLQDVLDVQSLDNVSIELLCNELTDLVYKGVAYQVIRRKFINNKQDSVEYRDHLLNYLQKSNIECIYSGLFFGMHSAFAKINNIDIENIELIVVQEHVPWHSMRYKKLFNPYFVFMMRDPRAALAGAWIRLKAAREDGNLHPYQFDHTIFYWKYAEAFVKKMARDNCNNVKVLKNEDMHKNLTYEMNELCEVKE